jgi:hypothetical protein
MLMSVPTNVVPVLLLNGRSTLCIVREEWMLLMEKLFPLGKPQVHQVFKPLASDGEKNLAPYLFREEIPHTSCRQK